MDKLPNNHRLVHFYATLELRRYTMEDLKHGNTFPSVFVVGWPKPETPQEVQEVVQIATEIAEGKRRPEEA